MEDIGSILYASIRGDLRHIEKGDIGPNRIAMVETVVCAIGDSCHVGSIFLEGVFYVSIDGFAIALQLPVSGHMYGGP